jgi:carbon storage regulator
MLVLSRKETQRIKVGDSIVVTVVRVAGDRVRLGIEAPPGVIVLREELEPRPRAASVPAATVPAESLPAASPGGGGVFFARGYGALLDPLRG